MAIWDQYLQENSARFQSELLDFLRIPSVSALPDHAGYVQQAAEWVSGRLREAGIEGVRILPTAGHPVVYGEWLHAPGRPTILLYGHFDTQPADPLDLWTHPPFEPVIKEDRVYARGASDDKGNMLVPILAMEAMLKTQNRLPVNVKFFFEGQEEIGSPHIPPFLDASRDLFACDLVVSADGGQWSEDQPELLVGCRGLCALQIDAKGASMDLHSGIYGGAVPNPIHALVSILDSMHSPDGRIQVEGFYDNVIPISDEERALMAAVPFDEAGYQGFLGIGDVFGEAGYTTWERAWARPTLEVNGIWGGFQGEGVKTVLPNEAHAKVTCRLVADQDPETVLRCVERHVIQHAPPGVKVSVMLWPARAKPYRMPIDHPGNRIADKVLAEIYKKKPYYTRTGGTVPVYDLFLSRLNAYTVTFGFGMEDERPHSPDEFFRLSSFALGQKAYCELLEELGSGYPS